MGRRSDFPLVNDTSTAETGSSPEVTLGRAYFLKESAPESPSFKKINEARDARFSEFACQVRENLLSAGKKGVQVKSRLKRRAETADDAASASGPLLVIVPYLAANPNSPVALIPPPLPRKARLVAFKRGMLVIGRKAPKRPENPAKRGDVTEFSSKSRVRCAWAFLNAETDWLAMVTLTYPTTPDVEEIRGHLRKWVKRLKNAFGAPLDFGWCVEATKAGRAHFHVFLGDGGSLGAAISSERCETIVRKGKPYQILRGEVESVAVEAWLAVMEQGGITITTECEAFQWGGIVERLHSPDAAARYVSKEASKRAQKGSILGTGCFWRLARHLKGKPRWMSSISKVGLSTLPSYSRIFDKPVASELANFKHFEQFTGETEDEVRESRREIATGKESHTMEERTLLQGKASRCSIPLPDITPEERQSVREYALKNPQRTDFVPSWFKEFD